MKIEELLKMDMGSVVEWLIENERYFELAPRAPNQDMLFGVDDTELNKYCISSRQSTQHEIGKSIYVEMIKRIK